MNYTTTDIRRLLNSMTMLHAYPILPTDIDDLDYTAMTFDESSAGNPIPNNWCRFTTIEFQVRNISGATAIRWYLSRNAIGTRPITPAVTTTFEVTTSGPGVASALIDVPYIYISDVNDVEGEVYLMARTDAGDARLVPILNVLSNKDLPALGPSEI